ncbi:MAG: type II toxin-antitoxin system RelE/ParE family toxin [Desulfobacterales bacterium]|nr:type II toxin-antitoxin system RelE/ParE family toxin [Desulfobacterales bacterium]
MIDHQLFQVLRMAIRSFKNKGAENINYGRTSKEALKILPKELHRRAQIELARLGAVASMQDLQEIPGNRFERLRGDVKGQYSIRINNQYRICFRWQKENALDVEIVDYH